MSELFAGLFFPKSKTSDVVPVEDVQGQACVGAIKKVRWHGRTYAAKILCIGDKEHCERKMELVSTDGEIQSTIFTRCPGTTEPPLSLESVCSQSDSHILEELSSSVKEILLRLARIENSAATRRLQVEESQRQQRLRDVLSEVKANSTEMLRRLPRSEERGDVFSFDYANQEFLEGLRKLCGGNINQFALDLEKEVYLEDTTELTVQVEKRIMTATKVEFIKECIYKYYLVPLEARQSVWRNAKGSLNARVRRLRSSIRGDTATSSTPSRVSQENHAPRNVYDFMDDESRALL